MNSTIENVALYISDTQLFEEKLERLNFFTDDKLLKRVNRWFDYFLDNYHESILFFESTVFVLLDASVSNQFFYSQTNYEVQFSLKYYEALFSVKRKPVKIDYKTASVFFHSSLFYSRYYGFQQTSFKESFSFLCHMIDKKTSKKSFEKLFVKYETPHILINNFDKYSSVEYSILSEVLSGKNIRNAEGIPLEISKKEAYILLNCLPKHFTFENEFVKRLIVASKILKHSPDSIYELSIIIESSKIFKYNLDVFIEDLDFWVDVFKYLIKVDDRELIYRNRDHIDYFEFQRYVLFADFSFKGRTVASITRLIRQWHDIGVYKKNLALLNKEWSKSAIPNFKINYQLEQYYFEEIITGESLYKEAQVLNHCVFSYINSCIFGMLQIWSMQLRHNNQFLRLITIEVSRRKITQIAGKHNRQITYTEFEVIKEFASHNNLKIHDEYILMFA